MESAMKAIEITGIIDDQGQLHLDKPLAIPVPGKVRVILLFLEDSDIDEQAWLRSAANNPAFNFLKDQVEDIYSASEGKPFRV